MESLDVEIGPENHKKAPLVREYGIPALPQTRGGARWDCMQALIFMQGNSFAYPNSSLCVRLRGSVLGVDLTRTGFGSTEDLVRKSNIRVDCYVLTKRKLKGQNVQDGQFVHRQGRIHELDEETICLLM